MAIKESLSVLFILSISLGAISCRDRIFDNIYDPDKADIAYEISAVLNIVNLSPLDLTFAEDVLWICDGGARITAVDYNSGQAIRSLSIGRPVVGIAYGEGDLWLSFSDSRQLSRVNALNGEVVRQLTLPRGEPRQLDFHRGWLYVADRAANVIMLVDPQQGVVKNTFHHPGFKIDGLAYDGRYVWTLDSSQDKLFREAHDGTPGNSYQAPARNLSGLCSGLDSIWLGERSGRVFRLRF